MQTDLADHAYSKRAMSLLLSSCTQQPADPKVFLEQLTIVGTGRPKDLLKLLVHPVEGILAKTKFIPSIAEVNEWLDLRDENVPVERSALAAPPKAYPLFPPIEEFTEDSEEEKQKCMDRWNATKPKKTRGVERILEEPEWMPIVPQSTDRDYLYRCLLNLEATNKPGDSEDGSS